MDTIEDMEIKKQSGRHGLSYSLYFKGCIRGRVTKKLNGRVEFYWAVSGPCDFEESKAWFAGLQQLIKHGEELSSEVNTTNTNRRARQTSKPVSRRRRKQKNS